MVGIARNGRSSIVDEREKLFLCGFFATSDAHATAQDRKVGTMTFRLIHATCDLETKRAYVEFRDETNSAEVILVGIFPFRRTTILTKRVQEQELAMKARRYMGKAAAILQNNAYRPTMAEALDLFKQLRRQGKFANVDQRLLV